MEYLILFAALCLIGVLAFWKGVQEQKKREAWMRDKCKAEFGKAVSETESTERSSAVSGYFMRHREGFYIDDVTDHDLDLERIFWQMNTAKSSAGQEYLYYMLRTPSFSEKVLADRERLMRFFVREEEIRVQLQLLFWKLGKTRKYSVYDYIDFLDNFGNCSNLKHILADLLFLPIIGILFISPYWGLLLLFGLIVYNISVYLKEKRKIDTYLVCFRYILKAIEAAQKLVSMPQKALQEELADEIKQIKQLLRQFSGFTKSARYGMHMMGDGGNPLEVAADYLNMLFHLDIIGFHIMLKQLQDHVQEADLLLGILGRIDALIAAASYRESLPLWCEPVLRTSVKKNEVQPLSMKQFYHPLITDAVKNDLDADRGVLVTGSNASGKSTFLKAVAINAILAQTIHTCAAAAYSGGFYRVLSSMALKDNLEGKESYYIVEIKSLKRILDSVKEDDAPVLCFVDEVLRGTNTVERIAASAQILKSLHKENVICFAATHDIELTELLETVYDNYHFQEQVENGDIFFPYRLRPGRAQTRNAIRLLAVMGYEEKIIEQADALAAGFLETGSWQQCTEGKERKTC